MSSLIVGKFGKETKFSRRAKRKILVVDVPNVQIRDGALAVFSGRKGRDVRLFIVLEFSGCVKNTNQIF
jgi:hypothetical protein